MPDARFIKAGQADELRAALREVSDEIAGVVHAELEEIARGVAADAARRVPRRSGAAQASYRARGSAVTFGEGVPYVPWLEFGGKVGRGGSVKRPYVRGGRYMYPAINAGMADIEARVDALIGEITGGYLEVD